MAYDYTIPYISREEYLEAKGVDLAIELQDDDNRSNKVNRFIHDITNFVLDYLTTEYKCNELNRITHNFADLAEQRRVRFHYGMIEQIEYILNNGLIHQNMGYNPETGGITDFSGVQICHGALQNFRLGGFCNMQRRSMPDCLTPADMPTIQELVLELAKKVDKVDGKGLSTNDFTEAQKMLLKNLGIEINQKVDKVSGKGLSSNDFTNELKQKLLSIAADAEANVIEEVCVNNSPLPISNKKVNVDLSYLLSESDFESWRSNFVETLEGLLNAKEDKSNKVTSLSAYSTDTEYPSAKATFDAIQSAISGVYQFEGAKTVAQLNALGMDSSMNGYVYNVLDNGNLQNGSGSTVSVVAGDNVAIVWDFDNNTFSWDKLAGEFTIDLNDYYTKTEVDDLVEPKANSADVYTKTEVDEFIVRKENKSNKVTSIDSSSNDAQYPTAKCVYDNLAGKVDKESGKGLSSNDYTNTEKTKLAGIQDNAEVNILEGVKVNNVDLPISSKKVNIDLSGYALESAMKTYAKSLSVSIDSSTFVISFLLKDSEDNILSSQSVDLPLESVVVSGRYDSENKDLILTLKNGQEITIPLDDIISGLVSEASLATTLENYYTKAQVDSKLADYAEKDGNYPLMKVGESKVAENLTAYSENSGLEQNSPFIFQTTARGSDVKFPLCKFRGLRGKTYAFNQLARLSDIASTTVNDITYSRSNGVMTVSGTASADTNLTIIAIVVKTDVVVGHSILLKWNLKGTLPDITEAFTGNAIVSGSLDFSDKIVVATRNDTYCQITIKSGATVDFSIQPQFFDIEGYGLTSVVEFNRLFPLPFYPFGSQLVSSQSSKLTTIGYNQFNELDTFIKVVAGQKYTIEGITSGSVVEYDGSQNQIKTNSITETTEITLTNDTRYVKVLGTGSDICFHLTWDGSRTGYEPYSKHEYALPNIALRSAGSVYDEIKPNGEHITRIGVRAYQSGDENDNSVLTDLTTTYYVLAEPTTEQVASFEENIVIDDFGTMEFNSTYPQGNDFFYYVDYKAFIDSLGNREDIGFDASKVVSQAQLQQAMSGIDLSGYVEKNTDGNANNITGVDFGNNVKVYKDSSNRLFLMTGENARWLILDDGTLRPYNNNANSIGTNTSKVKDVYMQGKFSNGTGNATIDELIALITYAKSQGWIQ